MEWGPLILTFKLALFVTVLLFILSVPIAYWLSKTNSRFRPVIEALVSMPLVLPPTVIGFYLLVTFSPTGTFGKFLEDYLGIRLIFSFQGLVLASIIYSLPFMVQPLQVGFKSIPNALSEASYVLGKSKWQTLIRVLLPNMKSSIITGLVLSFAHTIGEFGVVLMIGGNIPDQTRVASIAIYDHVEKMDYTGAHYYSLILFSVSFIILLLVYRINGGFNKTLSK